MTQIETWIENAKNGNVSDLGLLIQSQECVIHGICERGVGYRLRKRIGVEDVAQDVFLKIARDFHAFEGRTEEEFTAWCCIITKHTIASALAKHLARKRDIRAEVKLGQAAESGAVDESLSRIEGLDGVKEVLFASIESLSEAQAETLRLRYFSGLSVAEVADRLSISVSAAGGHLKRGLRKLRESAELAECVA